MVGSTKRVEVAFVGDGSGVDELAWGQREIWVSMLQTGSAKPVGGVKELSPETTWSPPGQELTGCKTVGFACTARTEVRRRVLLFSYAASPVPCRHLLQMILSAFPPPLIYDLRIRYTHASSDDRGQLRCLLPRPLATKPTATVAQST